MTDAEIIAELYTKSRRQDIEYANLLGLVARIKTGEVEPALILITGQSWQLIPGVRAEPAPQPAAFLQPTGASCPDAS